RRRLEFNLVYRVYENFLSYLQWNFVMMKTATYGTRSFLRILFAGYTPTELVANTLTDFKRHTSISTPAEWVVNKCTNLFTNNYSEGTKLIK
ncbi:MAG TPA: hypothetical protein PLJ21_12660, partial [Pseudobdellovibrionaceae bacterium]|nr:hypothetical protein [Pseudobdellovibrionaceae bacterium]